MLVAPDGRFVENAVSGAVLRQRQELHMTVIIEDLSLERATPLLYDLRAALASDVFSRRLAAAWTEGYRVIGAERNGEIIGVLGHRLAYDICWGKTFQVDDLNVAPQLRGSGIGSTLLNAAVKAAHTARCDHVRLCSGLSRHDAHRFYEAHGMQGFSKQFILKVDGA